MVTSLIAKKYLIPKLSFRMNSFEKLTGLLLPVLFVALLAGACGLLYFYLITSLPQLVDFLHPVVTTNKNEQSFNWLLLISMPIFGLLAGLAVYYIMPNRKNMALAPVIEEIHKTGGQLSMRHGFGVGIVSTLSIVAGSSVGRFGPALHFGASIGSSFANFLKKNRSERMLLVGCGAAAAIAAGFNAPIAAAIIVMEVIVRNLNIRFLGFTVIAAMIGSLFHKFFGTSLAFEAFFPAVAEHPDVGEKAVQYALSIGIGISSAYVAFVFLKMHTTIQQLGQKFQLDPRLKPMLGGLVLALIAMFVPGILGLGPDVVKSIFSYEYSWDFLLILLVFKALAISLSFAFGFNGGIFGPALFIGAASSAIFVSLAMDVFSFEFASPYLIAVGMAAVISCIFGAPIGVTMMIFELTGSYEVTSLVFIGTIAAHFINYRHFGRSFFDSVFKKNGTDISMCHVNTILEEKTVKGLVKDTFCVKYSTTIVELEEMLLERPQAKEIAIVDNMGNYKGIVFLANVLGYSQETKLKDIASTSEHTLSLDMSFKQAIEIFEQSGRSVLPVIDSVRLPRFAGIITITDILEQRQAAHIEAKHEMYY